MGKRLAAVGMAAGLAVGGLTVAALNPLGVAGAQDPGTEQPAGGAEERQGPLRRALAQLVEDGTLTQAQADAVLEATKAEAEAGHEERKAERRARWTETLAVVADALGSTPEDVQTALREGTSIAAQAEAAGVDRQVVADALAAHLTERIDATVAEGRITEDRAAKAKEHVDRAVERILDADGSGHGGRGGPLRERLRDRFGD